MELSFMIETALSLQLEASLAVTTSPDLIASALIFDAIADCWF